uniref:protein PATRONUS 1-like n=1 Tax=Erigeron canadensis TaxID=72917 RepID=UPI001CB930CB|nr:protein PATRONUS 1-like [Erigeron canadensis]XP_043614082.1 protein PATRONUS 1-like [Erigeron canadensis]
MSSHLVQQRLNNQNENSNIIRNKMMNTEIRKNSKLPLGKRGSVLGSRKALGDITNKPSIHKEASTQKKHLPKQEFSILEEKFLHDHNKCIESQKAMSESAFLDIVLPGRGPVLSEFPVSDSAKIDHDSFACYPKIEELPMPDFYDWLGSTPRPDSPLHLDSPPCSPRSWIYEEVEYRLKTESDE